MKFHRYLIFISTIFVYLFLLTTPIQAVSFELNPNPVSELDLIAAITFKDLVPSHSYEVCHVNARGDGTCPAIITQSTDSTGTLNFTFCADSNNGGLGNLFDPKSWSIKTTGCPASESLAPKEYTLRVKDSGQTVFEATFRIIHFYPTVNLFPINPKPSDNIRVSLEGRRPGGGDQNNYQVIIESRIPGNNRIVERCFESPGGRDFGQFIAGDYLLKVNEQINENRPLSGCEGGFSYWEIYFTVENDADGGKITKVVKDPRNADQLSSGSSTEGGFTTGTAGKNPCPGGTSGSCKTAIGNIPTDPPAFVGKILTIALSLAGALALIIMVIGAIKVLMSANDPQKVANGRDMIIGAVAGLLFLIFSVLILRYLGSDLFNFFTVT